MKEWRAKLSSSLSATLISTVPLKGDETISTSEGQTAVILSAGGKKPRIIAFQGDGQRRRAGRDVLTLWSKTAVRSQTDTHRITSLLPLNLDHVLVGCGTYHFCSQGVP